MIAVALLAAVLGAAVPAPATPADRVGGVLLVTVDTLRPDALGFVAGRNATPFIDALAREGRASSSAIAPTPLTFPSHAALHTGRLPRRLGLRDNGQLLPGGVPTLAEALRAGGFATAAFVSGYPLAREFGLDRGFDTYDDRLPSSAEGDAERGAAATTAAAVRWLSATRRPFFAWIHFYDPHYPYTPAPGFVRAGPQGAYLGEVAAVDAAFGDLRRAAEAAAGSALLTVLTADHGESLGEHGEGTHGFFAYDSTIAVPLVVHHPRRIGPGAITDPAPRLVDIAPTILELVEAPPWAGLDGRSLVPALHGESMAPAPAYLEAWQPWTSYGWSPLRALRHDGWKLVLAPTPELYDLRADPGERVNVRDRQVDRARRLQDMLLDIEAATSAAPAPVSTDPEAAARLAALGYVGSGAPAREPPRRGLRDPKDARVLREELTHADALFRRGRHREAADRFSDVLKVDADNRFALLRLGAALLRARDPRAARVHLQRLVQLDPAHAAARSALADALAAAEQHALAVEQRMEVARLWPRNPSAWSALGTALGHAGRAQDALAAFDRALDLRPGDADLLVRRSFAAHAAGRPEDAVRDLGAAARVQGRAFAHAGALGLLLLRLGRPAEAVAWLARSRPAEADHVDAQLARARIALDAGRRAEAREVLATLVVAVPAAGARVRGDRRLSGLLEGEAAPNSGGARQR